MLGSQAVLEVHVVCAKLDTEHVHCLVAELQPKSRWVGLGSGHAAHVTSVLSVKEVLQVSAFVHESCSVSPKKVTYVAQHRVGARIVPVPMSSSSGSMSVHPKVTSVLQKSELFI